MRLVNNFSAFFENKINDICAHIDNNDNEVRHLPDISYSELDKFKEVTLTDMKNILSKSKKNTLWKRSFSNKWHKKKQYDFDKLTVVFHKITNLSLGSGTFPKTKKEASVRPTLKSGEDQQNVESYRPISNLSFLGKVTEAAAKKQLTSTWRN